MAIGGHSAHVGNAPMAETDECRWQFDCGGVVNTDTGVPHRRPDGHQRQTKSGDEVNLGLFHRNVDADQTVNTLPQHVLGERETLVERVGFEIKEQHMMPLLAQGLFDSADDGRKEPSRQERGDNADDLSAPRRERGRHGRGHIVEGFGNLQDARAGGRAHPVETPQRAGDRGDGHARRPRHIGDVVRAFSQPVLCHLILSCHARPHFN